MPWGASFVPQGYRNIDTGVLCPPRHSVLLFFSWTVHAGTGLPAVPNPGTSSKLAFDSETNPRHGVSRGLVAGAPRVVKPTLHIPTARGPPRRGPRLERRLCPDEPRVPVRPPRSGVWDGRCNILISNTENSGEVDTGVPAKLSHLAWKSVV